MNIIRKFEEHRDEENSKSMENYMKNNFKFLGIKSPLRKDLQKEFLKQIDKNDQIDKELVEFLWNQECREFQYLAIDYLIKEKKKLQKEDIHFIKEKIITKSWWDSVDLIASHLVGEICKKYPDIIEDYILKWSKDENIWLRRSAIIYQLKYKGDVDTIILEKILKENLEYREFFIEKAVGWSLREYSKFNKEWVRNFIKDNNLRPLSKKEASKYLG